MSRLPIPLNPLMEAQTPRHMPKETQCKRLRSRSLCPARGDRQQIAGEKYRLDSSLHSCYHKRKIHYSKNIMSQSASTQSKKIFECTRPQYHWGFYKISPHFLYPFFSYWYHLRTHLQKLLHEYNDQSCHICSRVFFNHYCHQA